MEQFHGSYLPDDVTFLLKPVEVEFTPIEEKEAFIQNGEKHYSEMLTEEYQPSDTYLSIFHTSLDSHKQRIAQHVLTLAKRLANRPQLTLISLARAGTPIGVLLKRTLRDVFERDVEHYSISIIRDRGIDQNALRYLLRREDADARGRDIVFVDGWTGKGVISRELWKYVGRFNAAHNSTISPDLHVLSDLSGTSLISASLEDYPIPSALLNATVSGLISRSGLNEELIGAEDFHGCRYYAEWQENDLSLWYVEQIMKCIQQLSKQPTPACVSQIQRIAQQRHSEQCIAELMERYQIGHINYLKPGIGEAIRVLLRRVPERILVREPSLETMQAFLQLAEEKSAVIETVPELPYEAVGIIKTLSEQSDG